MTSTLNIRNEADRAALLAAGYTWVTVVPRGDNKGNVRSRHRTQEAAEKAARGVDRQILEVGNAGMY